MKLKKTKRVIEFLFQPNPWFNFLIFISLTIVSFGTWGFWFMVGAWISFALSFIRLIREQNGR